MSGMNFQTRSKLLAASSSFLLKTVCSAYWTAGKAVSAVQTIPAHPTYLFAQKPSAPAMGAQYLKVSLIIEV